MKGAKLMIYQDNINCTKSQMKVLHTNMQKMLLSFSKLVQCNQLYQKVLEQCIIKFFNEFMSFFMEVNRKELIFSPTTTSSVLQKQKNHEGGPFYFQALVFIHMPWHIAVQSPIIVCCMEQAGLKRESQLFDILGRRPFTKETNYAFGTRNRACVRICSMEENKQRGYDH